MWTVRIFFGFNAISVERNRKNALTQVIAAKLYQRKRCQCRREPLPTKTESQYECGCQRKCFKFTHLLQCTCNIAKHQKCGKLLVFRSVCEISVAHIGHSQSEQLLFIVFFSVFKIECIHLFWRCEVRFSIIFNEIFPMSTFISCISSIFLNQNYLIWSLLYFFNGFFSKISFFSLQFLFIVRSHNLFVSCAIEGWTRKFWSVNFHWIFSQKAAPISNDIFLCIQRLKTHPLTICHGHRCRMDCKCIRMKADRTLYPCKSLQGEAVLAHWWHRNPTYQSRIPNSHWKYSATSIWTWMPCICPNWRICSKCDTFIWTREMRNIAIGWFTSIRHNIQTNKIWTHMKRTMKFSLLPLKIWMWVTFWRYGIHQSMENAWKCHRCAKVPSRLQRIYWGVAVAVAFYHPKYSCSIVFHRIKSQIVQVSEVLHCFSANKKTKQIQIRRNHVAIHQNHHQTVIVCVLRSVSIPHGVNVLSQFKSTLCVQFGNGSGQW